MELRFMLFLGVPELLIILVIIVLAFGVGKLSHIGKALGQGIREFRGSSQGAEGEDVRETGSGESGPA
jgi:sec-independent protein translocase protein TatA